MPSLVKMDRERERDKHASSKKTSLDLLSIGNDNKHVGKGVSECREVLCLGDIRKNKIEKKIKSCHYQSGLSTSIPRVELSSYRL
jgi:hypothetical protein